MYKGDAGNDPELLAKYVDGVKPRPKHIWKCDEFKKELLKRSPNGEYSHISVGDMHYIENGGISGYLSTEEYDEIKFKRHVCGEMQDIAGILGDHADEAVERLLKLEKELAGYWGLPVP